MKTHKVIVTIFLLLIHTAIYLFAGTSQWRVSVQPTKTSTINATGKEGVNEGAISTNNICVGSTLLSSFQRILIESAESTKVDSCMFLFHAEVFLSDARLQNELHAVLFSRYPKKMTEAVESSGNLNNPKLSFLYSALKPAIKETPSMKNLSEIAAANGYASDIGILGGEKIQFRRKSAGGETFANPNYRVYGVFGFVAHKRSPYKKVKHSCRRIEIDAAGNILSDEVRVAD